MVNLTLDSSLCKNLGGFLEGCCGKEGFGLEGSLCNTEKHGLSLGKHQIALSCVDTLLNLIVCVKVFKLFNVYTGKHIGASGIGNAHLSGHLTGDNLDVLVVNADRLAGVDLLNLKDDIVVYGVNTVDTENIRGVLIALSQLLTGNNGVAGVYDNGGTEGNGIFLFLSVFGIGDNNIMQLLYIANFDGAAEFRNDCSLLRLSCLEQLLDSGKTLGNIASRHTAGMEGSHGKLCTGLTDGLSGYDTHSLADVDGLGVGKVGAVAVRAYAVACLTLEDGADVDFLDACGFNGFRLSLADHGVVLNNDLTGGGINHIADNISAEDTV